MKRYIVLLGAAFIIVMLLACTDVNDGSCKPPTPCGQNQGHNP